MAAGSPAETAQGVCVCLCVGEGYTLRMVLVPNPFSTHILPEVPPLPLPKQIQ